MSISVITLALIDNGGRRLGLDRRQFSYTDHIPNRRLNGDRRKRDDRRSALDRRNDEDRRSGEMIFKKIERAENDLREEMDRRNGSDRRAIFAAARVD